MKFKFREDDYFNSIWTPCELCDILKKNEVSTFRVFDRNKERVNLFGTIKAKKTSGKKPIILSGHTDVVPVSKGWTTDPFIAKVKGDKLFGRGSCDMKGFIACVTNIIKN